MAGKDDDFDEWLDDVDITDSDLDQGNIDDLLRAVDTEGNDQTDKADTERTGGELDQNNIDALLGLNSSDSDSQTAGGEAGMSELDQDNIDDLLSGTGYDADAAEDFNLDELEQDNIDALLAGVVDSDDSGEDDELAQDNIDALLAGAATESQPEEESQSELNQSNIDSLFNSAPEDTGSAKNDDLFAGADDEPAPVTEEPSDLEQDNIDALFNDLDADSGPVTGTAAAEEDTSLDALFADDKEAADAGPEKIPADLSPEDADELAATAFDSELDDMDLLFADLDNDVEDDDPFQAEEIDFAEMLGQTGGDAQEFIELDADDTTDTDDFMTQAGAEDDGDIEALPGDEAKAKKPTGLMLPVALSAMNKAVLAGMGGGVALLLLVGLYFLFSGPNETMETAQQTSIPVQQPSVKMVPENFIPVTEDAQYNMGSEGGEISIELAATDKDDQPLIYEITSQPLHGRLSGTAPLLTYLPDNTFPGEDRFEFTVSDGTDTSNLAVVTIAGPDLATMARAKIEAEQKKATAEKKIFKPQKPKVLAKDVTYFTISTGAVTIDWARLWQEANSSVYAPQEVHVEIVDTDSKGSLKKHDRASHIFTPDPYEARTDTIRYRFKKGGFRSATKTVSINIELGSPAPEINIATLTDGYLVGQNVVLDASGSRDEARESLQFFWEQAAGVQIDLRPMNTEGSKIAFTMPSSFYTDPNPDPILVVTAVDNTGKEVQKEIKVKMVSRRQTALWRGDNGNVAADPPMEGRYFPWPFDD